MSGTREKILVTLLNNPRSTISDLAVAAGINAISVRHHLASLQAADLIQSEEERHGVGRPRLVYSLSEKGVEQFPTSYLKLTNHLLEQMQAILPEAMLKKVLDQVAEDITAGYIDQVKGLPMNERLNLIKRLLKEEGFLIEWKNTVDGYEIREISCPYHHVGRGHPEICSIDQAILSKLLEIPVTRISCILRGDNHCTYIIPPENKR
jgi:DeoR family transcriptional regulator, suf operon transcriptional repressor